MWRGRAERRKVGGRVKWHRSQDENDKYLCVCTRVCARRCRYDAQPLPLVADSQPPIRLAGRQKEMAYYWPSVELCECVCMQTCVWKAAVFAKCASVGTPTTRGGCPAHVCHREEGEEKRCGCISMPSHRCVCMLRWVHKKRGIKIKQEIMRGKKSEGWKKQGNIVVGPPVRL